MPESEKKLPDPLSRTKRKNEMTALQKVGQKLVELSDTQLANIEIPGELLKAVLFARTLKTHESIRRQLQYIGKIMREIDFEAVKLALKKLQATNAQHTAQFHQSEQWREQLITEGDVALQKLLEIYPQADKQKLRQLIRKAQHDRTNDKNTGGETALFRCLRSLFEQ